MDGGVKLGPVHGPMVWLQSLRTQFPRDTNLPCVSHVPHELSIDRVSHLTSAMAKRLLMLAYHFPPLAGSSGIQRTLRFAKYLREFDWEPLILTAHPRAYERVNASDMNDVLPGTVVRRAFALDTSRHLAIARRYPAALARPDRWISWAVGAIPAGLAMIRKYKPSVIWSTYPIATAHVIGGRYIG